MQYIILDMEWNQPWPGSYSAKKALPSPMRGEIVQIGAVRMTQEQQVADEFQILIRPKYFKKMNRKVASLTGIRDSLLREKGVSFPEAAAQFAAWCGEDCVFLTWGFDDITILRENLAVFGLESGWTARWYNAQLIFNAQTDGSGAQKALSTAMQMMDIAPTRAAHDALGDAYHTALVCQKLRLAEGIAAYEAAVQAHENGFHGAELPGCVQRAVFHGYADKTAALGAMSGQENLCPVCGGQMTAGKWYPQQGRRYLSRARCETDGEFYIRIRLVQEDGTLTQSWLILNGQRNEAGLGGFHIWQNWDEIPAEQREGFVESGMLGQSSIGEYNVVEYTRGGLSVHVLRPMADGTEFSGDYDGAITGVYASDPNLATTRGLPPGDPWEKVEQVYDGRFADTLSLRLDEEDNIVELGLHSPYYDSPPAGCRTLSDQHMFHDWMAHPENAPDNWNPVTKALDD